MQKRGQITLFMIIGVILIILFGIVTFVFKSFDVDIKTTSPVKPYTEGCIEATLEKGLFEVGFSNMRKLEDFMNNHLKECTDDFTSFAGMNITEGRVISKINKTEDNLSIIVEVNYPLTIKAQDSTYKLDEFYVNYLMVSETRLQGVTTRTSIDSQNGMASVVFPAGVSAIDADGNSLESIKMSMKDKKLNPSSDEIVGELVYNLQPDGAEFDTPLKLIIRYEDFDDDGIVDGTDVDENEIKIANFDENTQTWVNLNTQVDTKNNFAESSITHFSDYGLTEDYTSKGNVFPVSMHLTPTPEIVKLTNLEGEGRLIGKRLEVINFCNEDADYDFDGAVGVLNVERENNSFIYNPEDKAERAKFAQVLAYYYGELTADYYNEYFYKPFGEKFGFDNKVPFFEITLCDPDWFDYAPEDFARGATYLRNTNIDTMIFSCYSDATCKNAGEIKEKPEGRVKVSGPEGNVLESDIDPPIYDKLLDLQTVIHEYTHGVYVAYIIENGLPHPKDRKDWADLNEVYACIVPRKLIKDMLGEWVSETCCGDFDNEEKYGFTGHNEENSIRNQMAMGAAFYEAMLKLEEKEDGLFNELLFGSWENLPDFKNMEPGRAAMIALIETSKQKYGVFSKEHKDNREIITTAFENHDVVCLDCVVDISPMLV